MTILLIPCIHGRCVVVDRERGWKIMIEKNIES